MYIAKKPGNRYVVTAVTKDTAAFLNTLYEAYELLLYRNNCSGDLEEVDYCTRGHNDKTVQFRTE